MKRINNIPLLEYAGRSLDVLRASYALGGMIKEGFYKTQWRKCLDNLYLKSIVVTVPQDSELYSLVNVVNVNVFFPSVAEDEDALIDKLYELGKWSNSTYLYHGKRFIELSVIIYNENDLQNKLQGSLEHELMHCYQRMLKKGSKLPKPYEKAVKANNTLEANDTESYIKWLIPKLFYAFSDNEIAAYTQEIWGEMVRCGSYEECPTYKYRYKTRLESYELFKRFFEGRYKNFIEDEIVNQLEIPPSYYFKTVEKGVRKFKVNLGKIIARYNEMSNTPQRGSFKKYVENEIEPQDFQKRRTERGKWADKFHSLTNNINKLWQRR